MGTYTPNYNLYMPEVGETGWGQLVSNNFEIIDNAIGDGTRTITILPPNTDNLTITQKIFDDISYYDEDNILYANFGGNIILKTIYPYHSCRLMIIIVNGNAIIDGNIDTYPAILQIETPPNSPETNTYTNDINFVNFSSSNITVIYSSNENNSQITMNYSDYLNLIYNKIPTTSSNQSYTLSIPAATAAGGTGNPNTGTAGTADNTCNGGGGKGGDGTNGGTGCIFGQYECNLDILSDAYGYGSGASKKYRCGLIFIINGNLIINGTITQNGGNAYGNNGGYGGGGGQTINSFAGGGGGAPVFIYYTGTYTNNGTINTAGGKPTYSSGHYGGSGGAGGIKVTKISI